MAKERRRRGRRRGKNQEEPGRPPEQPAEQPGAGPSEGLPPEGEQEKPRQRERAEKQPVARRSAGASPLSFWRRGRPRTYRDQLAPKQASGGLRRRFVGFQLPPWVPVVTVMLIVFGILGGVFIVRGSTGSPRVRDHWHAALQMFVFGERQPLLLEFDANPEGIHTHGDNIIHLHPFIPAGEGSGAAIGRFFEYAGQAFGTGELSSDTLQVPGEDEVWRNGDLGPDGEPGVVQILRADSEVDPDVASFTATLEICDALPRTAYEEVGTRYIPQHGDCMLIVFGPEGEFPLEAAGEASTSEPEEPVASATPTVTPTP